MGRGQRAVAETLRLRLLSPLPSPAHPQFSRFSQLSQASGAHPQAHARPNLAVIRRWLHGGATPSAHGAAAGASAAPSLAAAAAAPSGLGVPLASGNAAAARAGAAAAGAGAAGAAGAGARAGVVAATPGQAASLVQQLREAGTCYYQLSKTKLSLLVAATAGAGFMLGSGESVDWAQAALTCTGTLLTAACANTLNQVSEVRNDAAMKRTMRRPLPSGRISKGHALAWACVSGLAGTAILMPRAHGHGDPAEEQGAPPASKEDPAAWLPASLAVANIVLYAGVYTPLKQIHPINTWVGAVVGAIPPLIGWTAASGHGLLDFPRAAGAWFWGAVLFFWQLPHFFALSWICRHDYQQGGYKMLSVVDPTGRRTAAAALRNSALLLPLGPLACAFGVASYPFAIETTLLSAALTAAAVPFVPSPTPATARTLFRASLLFLPAYMGAMALHRTPLPSAGPAPLGVQAPSSVALPQWGVFEPAFALTGLAREGAGAQLVLQGDSSDKESSASVTAGAEESTRRAGAHAVAVLSSSPATSEDCVDVKSRAPMGDGPHDRPRRPLPPVAYVSAAPFPFLPAPYSY